MINNYGFISEPLINLRPGFSKIVRDNRHTISHTQIFFLTDGQIIPSKG